MSDQALTPPETVATAEAVVSCDGGASQGNAALGHPAVYLKLGNRGRVRCPYCDREFVLARGAGSAGGDG